MSEAKDVKFMGIAFVLFAVLIVAVCLADLNDAKIELRDNALNRSSVIILPNNEGNIDVVIDRVNTVIKQGGE